MGLQLDIPSWEVSDKFFKNEGFLPFLASSPLPELPPPLRQRLTHSFLLLPPTLLWCWSTIWFRLLWCWSTNWFRLLWFDIFGWNLGGGGGLASSRSSIDSSSSISTSGSTSIISGTSSSIGAA